MDIEINETRINIWAYIGYILTFFIFTTALFFVLFFLKKLPESWNYLHVFLISIFIIMVGKTIKLWLDI